MSAERSHAFRASSLADAYERYLLPYLFEPWARELIARSAIEPGMSVLDVASGVGTVARLAAKSVGPTGRVVASDISAEMLAIAARTALGADSAAIECVECSAAALSVEPGSFDRVLCQQGLQFFPERLDALRAMRRALAPDGVALIAVWAAEQPLGLFGPMTEAVRETGISEPFPGAFEVQSFAMAAGELRRLLDAAGYDAVSVETVKLACSWPTSREVLDSVSGSVFGPAVAALPPESQDELATRLLALIGADGPGEVVIETASHIAVGR